MLSLVCRKHLEKSGNFEDWKVATLLVVYTVKCFERFCHVLLINAVAFRVWSFLL